MSDISREELAAILADTKQMWEALAAVAMQVKGAEKIVGPRAKLPQVIDMVFEQAGASVPEVDALKAEAEHLRMQIGYIATELMLAGDKRPMPQIVETAAKMTAPPSPLKTRNDKP